MSDATEALAKQIIIAARRSRLALPEIGAAITMATAEMTIVLDPIARAEFQVKFIDSLGKLHAAMDGLKLGTLWPEPDPAEIH